VNAQTPGVYWNGEAFTVTHRIDRDMLLWCYPSGQCYKFKPPVYQVRYDRRELALQQDLAWIIDHATTPQPPAKQGTP